MLRKAQLWTVATCTAACIGGTTPAWAADVPPISGTVAVPTTAAGTVGAAPATTLGEPVVEAADVRQAVEEVHETAAPVVPEVKVGEAAAPVHTAVDLTDDAAAPVRPVVDAVQDATAPVRPAIDAVEGAAAAVRPAVDAVEEAAAPARPVVEVVEVVATPLRPAVKAVEDAATPVRSAIQAVEEPAPPVRPAVKAVEEPPTPVRPVVEAAVNATAPLTSALDTAETTATPLQATVEAVNGVSAIVESTIDTVNRAMPAVRSDDPLPQGGHGTILGATPRAAVPAPPRAPSTLSEEATPAAFAPLTAVAAAPALDAAPGLSIQAGGTVISAPSSWQLPAVPRHTSTAARSAPVPIAERAALPALADSVHQTVGASTLHPDLNQRISRPTTPGAGVARSAIAEPVTSPPPPATGPGGTSATSGGANGSVSSDFAILVAALALVAVGLRLYRWPATLLRPASFAPLLDQPV